MAYQPLLLLSLPQAPLPLPTLIPASWHPLQPHSGGGAWEKDVPEGEALPIRAIFHALKYGTRRSEVSKARLTANVVSVLSKCLVAMLILQQLAFVGLIQCLPWDGVKPTGNLGAHLAHQEPPKPTPPIGGLLARQAPGDFTCGYMNAIACRRIPNCFIVNTVEIAC